MGAEIITEASYEIARAFVQQNARAIMINRKEDQGSNAISKIKQEIGEQAQIEWLPCDLGSLKDVKEVFSRMAKSEERLDLVRVITESNPYRNKFIDILP